MNELYEFTKVNALAHDSSRNVVHFRTDRGQQVWIRQDEVGKVDARFVQRASAEGSVIFVAFDPTSGACRFAVPFNEDYVGSVEASRASPQDLEVSLLKRPSYLSLKASHPRFAELRAILQNAKAANKLVWVGTFPGDSEILDVRLAPE